MRGEGEEAGGGIDAEKKTEQPRGTRLINEMTEAAARLIGEAIRRADPEDARVLRQITGALKDLKELMDESAGEGEGIVIRIEGDVVPPEEGAGEECR